QEQPRLLLRDTLLQCCLIQPESLAGQCRKLISNRRACLRRQNAIAALFVVFALPPPFARNVEVVFLKWRVPTTLKVVMPCTMPNPLPPHHHRRAHSELKLDLLKRRRV